MRALDIRDQPAVGPDEDYGGPAKPSPTIAQSLNGGYTQALHEAKSGRSCEISDHATAFGRAVRRAVDRDLNEVRTATTRSRTSADIVALDYAVAWSVRRVDKSRDFRDGTFRTRRDVQSLSEEKRTLLP